MTYEENLRKTAEELYNMSPDVKCFRWEGCAIQHNEVEAFIPLSEYCLKKQAEAYREAFVIGFSSGYDSIAQAKERVTVKLKTLGLIP